jgi:hypothetical protein
MKSETLRRIIEPMGGKLVGRRGSWLVWFDGGSHGYRCNDLYEVKQLLEVMNEVKSPYEYILWNGEQWVVTM